MLSNSNPKNTNKEDNFFEDIYKGFNINEVSAKRMINSKAQGRGEISELLITNYLEKNIIKETTGYSRNQIFAFEKYIDLFLK